MGFSKDIIVIMESEAERHENNSARVIYPAWAKGRNSINPHGKKQETPASYIQCRPEFSRQHLFHCVGKMSSNPRLLADVLAIGQVDRPSSLNLY